MTHKEKAIDLVQKMARIDGYTDYIDISSCQTEIEYAIITVDELIKASVCYDNYNATYFSQVPYWRDVKKELNKLKKI